MNRKILFRGKCVSDSKYAGEWVTGGYVPLSEDITPNKEGLIMRFLGGNTTITYHVDPDTVGQFTNMKDKHGNKVFEGDIVEYGRSLYVCEFVEGGFAFRDISDDRLTLNAILIKAEVIGNIHNNPELLSTK